MEKKLSIIVPVYNVAPYLDECIGSILSQANDECEVILVDDGSTDGSEYLCDVWAEKSAYVKVIHQRNGGVSSARNAGVKAAKGEYVSFVDSDDRIAAGAVLQILEWIRQGGTDICFLNAIKFFSDGSVVDLGDDIHFDCVNKKAKEDVFNHLATRPKYSGSACTKIVRKAMLQQNDIHFPLGRGHAEDLSFVLECLLRAESFDKLDTPFYEYRQSREGSASSAVSKKSFLGVAEFVAEAAAKLTSNHAPYNEISRCAMAFVAYEYSILLWQYAQVENEAKERAHVFLKEYKWVVNYAGTIKVKALRTLVSLLGITITSKILMLYMNLRRIEK